jgi:hypothetical protein
MDCSCVGLTIDYRDLPGATADAAEAPMAPTQGGVGKLTTAAAASAIASFDLGNRASTIEHLCDRSGPGQPLHGLGRVERLAQVDSSYGSVLKARAWSTARWP